MKGWLSNVAAGGWMVASIWSLLVAGMAAERGEWLTSGTAAVGTVYNVLVALRHLRAEADAQRRE